MRHMRDAFAVLLLFVAAFVAPARAQRPEIRARIDAFVKALSSGSPDQFEAMARANYTPELLDRTSATRRTTVARIHSDFGAMTVAGADMSTPTHATLQMHSATNDMPLAIEIDFEATAPFRIASVSIRAGGPAGGRGGPPPLPPPPVNGRTNGPELSDALDAYLGGLARSNEFAGVVLVAKDGRALFQKPYGVADRDHGTPMSADLRFNVASIGKAFTKTAVGQLIQAGRLKESDTIGALLPDYPNTAARSATVDQLLHFQVGIADFFGEKFAAMPKDRFQSNHDYYDFVAPQPLKFAPGERTEYCNGCFVVLGEIVTRISGEPYERYVEEHVFKPAGMTSAGFLAFGDPHVALGYTRTSPGRPWTSAVNMHGHHGSAAGGAYAAVSDLLAFDNAIRTHVLLNPKMTAWYFENPADETRPRATDAYGIAGGAPGANASLESNGEWTIVTLGNLDPPNAVRVGEALAHALYGQR